MAIVGGDLLPKRGEGGHAARTLIGRGAGLDVSDATASDISSAGGATTALGDVDDALKAAASTRAPLGAGQSRLKSVVNNLSNQVVNLSDARSRMEDADFSAESTNLAKAQILAQASTAMVAQA